MKFQKTWYLCFEQLPEYFQLHTIHYKTYKKMIQKKSGGEVFEHLQSDVDRLVRFIQTLENIYCNKNGGDEGRDGKKMSWSLVSCLGMGMIGAGGIIFDSSNWGYILRFLSLNRTVIYKVCKKIDKVMVNRDAMTWLEQKRAEYVLGDRLSSHVLLKHNQEYECPICIENKNDKHECFVFNCGHIVCIPCFMSMHKIQGHRGTLRNTIIHIKHVMNSEKCIKCPLCRCKMNVYQLKSMNAFPLKLMDSVRTWTVAN